MKPLDDDELNRALASWRVPGPSPHMEARALIGWRANHPQGRGWRRLLYMRVALPLPAVAALVAVLLCLSVLLARMEMRTEPSVRNLPAAVDFPRPAWEGLQPVAELKPRIIKGTK